MSPHEKAAQTMKEQLLKIIQENPGIEGTSVLIPKHLRRFLRELELEQSIKYAGGWYLK